MKKIYSCNSSKLKKAISYLIYQLPQTNTAVQLVLHSIKWNVFVSKLLLSAVVLGFAWILDYPSNLKLEALFEGFLQYNTVCWSEVHRELTSLLCSRWWRNVCSSRQPHCKNKRTCRDREVHSVALQACHAGCCVCSTALVSVCVCVSLCQEAPYVLLIEWVELYVCLLAGTVYLCMCVLTRWREVVGYI